MEPKPSSDVKGTASSGTYFVRVHYNPIDLGKGVVRHAQPVGSAVASGEIVQFQSRGGLQTVVLGRRLTIEEIDEMERQATLIPIGKGTGYNAHATLLERVYRS